MYWFDFFLNSVDLQWYPETKWISYSSSNTGNDSPSKNFWKLQSFSFTRWRLLSASRTRRSWWFSLTLSSLFSTISCSQSFQDLFLKDSTFRIVTCSSTWASQSAQPAELDHELTLSVLTAIADASRNCCMQHSEVTRLLYVLCGSLKSSCVVKVNTTTHVLFNYSCRAYVEPRLHFANCVWYWILSVSTGAVSIELVVEVSWLNIVGYLCSHGCSSIMQPTQHLVNSLLSLSLVFCLLVAANKFE